MFIQHVHVGLLNLPSLKWMKEYFVLYYFFKYNPGISYTYVWLIIKMVRHLLTPHFSFYINTCYSNSRSFSVASFSLLIFVFVSLGRQLYHYHYYASYCWENFKILPCLPPRNKNKYLRWEDKYKFKKMSAWLDLNKWKPWLAVDKMGLQNVLIVFFLSSG